MEALILDEVEKCNEMFSKEVNTITQLSLKLNIAIVNALWKLLTGEKVSLFGNRCLPTPDLVRA